MGVPFIGEFLVLPGGYRTEWVAAEYLPRVPAAVARPRIVAAADHDSSAVLTRVIAKVLEAGRRMPNYTCVETVTRVFYRPTGQSFARACSVVMEQRQHPTLDMVLRPYSTDRLRLDVTMADHGEIFSWAGASKFDDAGIEHLISEGPIGTGAFGAYLLAVFNDDQVKFVFVRNNSSNGRELMEYSFRVPLSGSHYKIKAGDQWVFTAYRGTFQVDPATDDLVQLVVQTEDLPLATGTCMSMATMDYAPVQIGPSQFLRPTQMKQQWVDSTGNEVENTTTFTACREYKGESTLTFLPEGGATTAVAGEPGRDSADRKTAAAIPPIPAGLRFSMVLSPTIDTNTAAAGDLFTGSLAEPLKDARSKVLAPKGSLVEGRIIRLEILHRPPQVLLVLRPRSVEAKGVKTPLAAALDLQNAAIANRDMLKRRVGLYLPRPGEERTGSFGFLGNHVVTPKGFRTEWRTLGMPPAEPAHVPGSFAIK
jgi:hypothetical protein